MRVANLTTVELFERIIVHGGITYSTSRRRVVSKGYAVSPYKGREAIFSCLRVQHLRDYISRNRDLLGAPGHCLGAWLNPADGRVYLDVSIAVADIGQANSLALKHRQIAFYDLNRGVTVDTVQPYQFERFIRTE
jgi:hypothetical protein